MQNQLLKQFRNKFILITLLAAGCATTYQREGFFTNGYSDTRVSKDVFVITFRASEYTSQEEVYQLALQRASELTLKSHYKYFTIIEQTSLHYPSIRLKIQCYHWPEAGTFDAEQFLKQNV